MKINAQWHKENRMPKSPSVKERIEWHKEHAKKCACRPIPLKLQERINQT